MGTLLRLYIQDVEINDFSWFYNTFPILQIQFPLTSLCAHSNLLSAMAAK